MKLLFVINNIQEAYYEYENTGSMPAVKKRSVEIELTDEQVRKIGIRNIGYSSRTPITETIESVSLLLEGAVQADKHPESLWISVTERLPEDDFNCIVTEAERYINSVWHDMKEKPDFKKLPVLLKHKSGVIHFIDSTPTSWKYLIKHYVKWVYIRDLLPNEEK